MGNSRIRAKVRRRRVAILAAKSRQFDVKNHLRKLGNPEITEFKYNKDSEPRIAIKQNGKTFIQEGFGTISLPRGVDDNGNPMAPFEIKQHGRYLLVSDKPDHLGMRFHLSDRSWEYERHKQTRSLHKKYKKKYYYKHSKDIRKIIEHPSDYDQFKNYPYNLPKMNKVEYMEKLVQHKTARWERKNPKPLDMFTEEVEKWKQLRENAIERIRDFVVSVYDPLLLTGRFVMNKESSATYQEEKIAEIKDINGEGHKVNALPKDSKLMKKAQKVVDETKHKRNNLVCGNLRDHKRKTGRIILPKAA
jgi:hypothetical protein